MHELSTKISASPIASSNRSFGIIFSLILFLYGSAPIIHGETFRPMPLIFAGILATTAIICPKLLGPAKSVWIRFGDMLHKIASPISLSLIFCMAVIPTAVLIRLLRKDPLRLKIDPKVDTYWIDRTPAGPSPDSLRKQY